MATAEFQQQDLDPLDLFARMARIRAFEREVQELFKHGKLPGFVHLYIGEEAVAVGACSALARRDRHHLAPTRPRSPASPRAPTLEPDDGRAARQARPATARARAARCTSSTIALGHPRRQRDRRRRHPDRGRRGTGGEYRGQRPRDASASSATAPSNQGVFHEAMNLAAIWKLPVIFVCENNQYTRVDPSDRGRSPPGEIADRGRGVAGSRRVRRRRQRRPRRPRGGPTGGRARARR